MLTKSLENLLERLEELNPEAVVLGDLNNCIIGMCVSRGNYILLYSGNAIVKHFEKNMSREEAEDYYVFNIENAYFGEGSPVILFEEDMIEDKKWL